jgi:hypothetical protein
MVLRRILIGILEQIFAHTKPGKFVLTKMDMGKYNKGSEKQKNSSFYEASV